MESVTAEAYHKLQPRTAMYGVLSLRTRRGKENLGIWLILVAIFFISVRKLIFFGIHINHFLFAFCFKLFSCNITMAGNTSASFARFKIYFREAAI